MLLAACAAPAFAQVELPEFNRAEPILISARAANQWQQGSYEVWLLRGDCVIQQGTGYARCNEAVLWIDRAEVTEPTPNKVVAYLEGGANSPIEIAVDRRSGSPQLNDRVWFGRFHSAGAVQVQSPLVAGKPDVLPPIYWRAMEHRKPGEAEGQWHSRVEATQYTAPAPAPLAGNGVPATTMTPVPPLAPTAINPMAGAPVAPPSGNPMGGLRRIRVFQRSEVPMQFSGWSTDPAGNQWIATVDSGVNVIIDGASIEGLGQLGTIEISTDRLVIWASGVQQPDLTGQASHDNRTPLEFYMEGNIVFRQGDRKISADRMYYDVSRQVGTILNAEMLTPVPNYQGKLRLQAAVVQQTGQDRFFAQNAFLTSSRIGEPGYRLQSGDIYFEDIQQPVVDPVTGQTEFEHKRHATASNNFLFAGPVPVFYWPTISTDLEDSAFYIKRVQLKNDNVFGTQFLTTWNGYDLLGIRNKPAGTDFDISLGYLSNRGFGHGGSFTYSRDDLFGFGQHAGGLISYWGIQDHGLDTLGDTRRNLDPEQSYRGRLFWQHRQLLSSELQVSAELGWISDRNFLEEFYKSEWEDLKDQTTDVELKHMAENRSLSLFGQARINDFYSQTEWLPRLDHYWQGQSLLNDTFTWYEHSSAGYARFERLNQPKNPQDQPFSYLPWETQDSVAGERFATRQEIDYPFQIGPVKIVPFLMGEAAHWGQDLNGESVDRLWGEAGIRASMPMWSVNPMASSELFNVHGLAHKVVWKAEFTASDSNRDLLDLPLYDPLDDDSVEASRRHFYTTTFGGATWIPPGPVPIQNFSTPYMQRFDSRLYALRTGLQDWTTSPSTEIAGDLMALRFGAEQRWQTKRGSALNPRIIDFVTLDTDITFFPEPSRDNYGAAAGLADYNFVWHPGDRLTFLSDGIFDFFDDGQKLVRIGGFLSRPPRGSLYAGFEFLDGPIHNRILSVAYSYRMSPKWVSSFGTTVDLANNGNIGENFNITRVGESFLISAGFNVDMSRKSVGANFAIEPRFLPKSRLGRVSGAEIPPAGASGLE